MAENCKVPGMIGDICRNQPDTYCALCEHIKVSLGLNDPSAARRELSAITYQSCHRRGKANKMITDHEASQKQ